MAPKKTPCSICGKPCRGIKCRDCIKATKKTTEVCPLCGGPKGHGADICRTCLFKKKHEEHIDRLNKRKEESPKYFCSHCGKEIPWDPSFSRRIPKYCSLKCAGHAEKHNHPLWHTKEEIVKKIEDEIDKIGYVTREHLNKVLHISDKVLTRLGLRLTEINANKGKFFHEDHHKVEELFLSGFVGTLSEAKELLGIKKDTRIFVKELRRKAGTEETVVSWSKEEIEKKIIEYIQSVKRSVTTKEIIMALHVDYDAALKNNNVNVKELCQKAGYPIMDGPSVYEVEAHDILEQSTECVWEYGKTFDTLRSCKSSNKLRLDLFCQELNVIVEIDGPEHYNKGNPEVKSDYDKQKNKWSEDNNIPLYRIPLVPFDTFSKRVEDLGRSLGPRKNNPLNCWKRTCDQPAANPVSNQEGSEIIESVSDNRSITEEASRVGEIQSGGHLVDEDMIH